MGTTAHAVAPAVLLEGSRTNRKAIASLVLGMLGLVLVPLVASIAALGLGISARREIRREPGTPGDGLAIAGIALGGVGIALMLALVLFIVGLRLSV